MSETTSLKEVLARVEAATEPSRDLDRDVWYALLPDDHKMEFNGVPHVAVLWMRGTEPLFAPLADQHDYPRFTSSIEAILDEADDLGLKINPFKVIRNSFWLIKANRKIPDELVMLATLLKAAIAQREKEVAA